MYIQRNIEARFATIAAVGKQLVLYISLRL